MEASNLINEFNRSEYLTGMDDKEIKECLHEFNEYNSRYRVTSPQQANERFVEFMEEEYNHTYCDVCGFSYHNEDPCAFH